MPRLARVTRTRLVRLSAWFFDLIPCCGAPSPKGAPSRTPDTRAPPRGVAFCIFMYGSQMTLSHAAPDSCHRHTLGQAFRMIFQPCDTSCYLSSCVSACWKVRKYRAGQSKWRFGCRHLAPLSCFVSGDELGGRVQLRRACHDSRGFLDPGVCVCSMSPYVTAC